MNCQDLGGNEQDGYCVVVLSSFEPPFEGDIILSIPLDYLSSVDKGDVLLKTAQALSAASEKTTQDILREMEERLAGASDGN